EPSGRAGPAAAPRDESPVRPSEEADVAPAAPDRQPAEIHALSPGAAVPRALAPPPGPPPRPDRAEPPPPPALSRAIPAPGRPAGDDRRGPRPADDRHLAEARAARGHQAGHRRRPARPPLAVRLGPVAPRARRASGPARAAGRRRAGRLGRRVGR